MKLEGVRVLDLALFLPGPYLSQLMADHGAEVIKLEPPGEGDPGRHIGLGEHGHSVFFRNLNRGKKSVSLNLKTAAGREALLRIAATVDVFIEAFRPGVAARLGFDYEAVRQRNPRVIYVSLTAFGQTGPYRDVPAHNLACEALAGTVSVNLGQDGLPAMPHVPVSDFAAASMGLAGVLMALYRREKTGTGDRIDISMHDAALAWLPNVLGPVFVQKRAPVPQHERTWGGGAFYRIYRTRDDRHVVLGGQELKFARNLLGEWGRPDLIELCERGPGPHQQPVVEFLQGVFATRTQAEWVEWFRGRDICFAPVKNLREAFDDPQVRSREMRLVDELGQEHIGLPIKYSAEPGRADFRLPQLGEHTEEVLRAAGYSDAEMAALREDGAF
ncbi:MAG: CoA transferase [Steroidobacteraceae bacterium]|nr:CoA transferase [Steroidobacteraceae bacterium]